MTNEAKDSIALPECVQMKHRIQQQIDERFEGLTDEERHAREIKEIKNDPIIGPLYERLMARAAKDKGSSGRAA